MEVLDPRMTACPGSTSPVARLGTYAKRLEAARSCPLCLRRRPCRDKTLDRATPWTAALTHSGVNGTVPAAWSLPLPSPKNTRSPATTRPDFAGWATSIFQTILPVRVSVAPKTPKGFDPGTLLMKLDPRWRKPLTRSVLLGRVLKSVGSYRVP